MAGKYMNVVDDVFLYDLTMRLVAAVFLGGLLGLNRDLHRKPAGIRTLALVSLGGAMATILVLGPGVQNGTPDIAAVSRVLQGILTGIGFIGVGVIIRDAAGHVSGLTTAATIWVSAIMGTLCGFGYWQLITVSTLLIMAILIFGGRLEKFAERMFKRQQPPPEQ